MDPIAPVSSTHSAERIAALWLEIAAQAQAAEHAAPGADSPRSAQIQAVAQPAVQPMRTGPAAVDLLLPAADPGLADIHALPDSALVPATLTSLRLDPGAFWSLPHTAVDPNGPVRVPTPADEEAEGRADADDEVGPRDTFDDELVDDAVAVDGPESEWCAALSRKLRYALAGRAPAPLVALAEQWERGRCALLVCPQGLRGGATGWAFVLWPYPMTAGALLPALYGIRVPVRLAWQAMPHGAEWIHARLMREHHRRHGRQLVAADPVSAGGRVACQVQLGPVAMPGQPSGDVRVQIDAAQRVWSALGRQWSVHLALCSAPLLPVETRR